MKGLEKGAARYVRFLVTGMGRASSGKEWKRWKRVDMEREVRDDGWDGDDGMARISGWGQATVRRRVLQQYV